MSGIIHIPVDYSVEQRLSIKIPRGLNVFLKIRTDNILAFYFVILESVVLESGSGMTNEVMQYMSWPHTCVLYFSFRSERGFYFSDVALSYLRRFDEVLNCVSFEYQLSLRCLS